MIGWRTGTSNKELEILEEPKENFQKWNQKKTTLWIDVFKLTKIKGKGNELNYVCVIPEHRIFWEIILAFYLLFFPETFPDSKSIGETLYDFFDTCKVDPRGVKNFKVQHWKFIEELKEGKRELKFITNPIECFVALFSVVWGNSLDDDLKKNEEIWNKEVNNLIEKKTEELMEQGYQWEKEWLSIREKEKIE